MEQNKNNLYFIDFETGGLKSWVNGVSSFAIQNLHGDYKKIKHFRPQNKVYEYQALKTNGLKIEDLYEVGDSRQSVIDIFNEIYDNQKESYIIIAGWNVMFDIEFLHKIYKEKNVNLPCPILALDLKQIAEANIKKKDGRKKDDDGVVNHRLTTIYEYFYPEDFEEEKAHGAEYDVYMCRVLYDFFVNKGWIDKNLL